MFIIIIAHCVNSLNATLRTSVFIIIEIECICVIKTLIIAVVKLSMQISRRFDTFSSWLHKYVFFIPYDGHIKLYHVLSEMLNNYDNIIREAYNDDTMTRDVNFLIRCPPLEKLALNLKFSKRITRFEFYFRNEPTISSLLRVANASRLSAGTFLPSRTTTPVVVAAQRHSVYARIRSLAVS